MSSLWGHLLIGISLGVRYRVMLWCHVNVGSSIYLEGVDRHMYIHGWYFYLFSYFILLK